MHLETLLYMLLQSDKTVPPPGVTPDFVALADQATNFRVPNQWVKIPASEITIGLNDPENEALVWDNEKPARRVHVGAFESKSRGLTNADYALYLKETSKDTIPASWATTTQDGHHDTRGSVTLDGLNQSSIHMDGESQLLTGAFLRDKVVRTVYGPVPLAYALDWPVIASYRLVNAESLLYRPVSNMDKAVSWQVVRSGWVGASQQCRRLCVFTAMLSS